MRISNRRVLPACTLGLFALAGLRAFAQDIPSPKVGGASTFDVSPGISGTDNSGGRRRLGDLAAIPEDFSTLKLSSGFLLSMEVYDAPELSGDLRVDPNGDVTVPMIGAVHIVGETIAQAAAVIAERLKQGKILNAPQVNLNVIQYAGGNITVLGEVHNPGRIELLAPHSIADVVAMAGGETQFAGSIVEIRRKVNGIQKRQLVRYVSSDESPDGDELLVSPGDSVTVRRAGIVYVLGGVNRPGGYLMQEEGSLTVTQALSLAYGTNLQAAVGSMRLIRKMPDGTVREFPIPYHDMVKGKVAPAMLQAEDVIYVPISKTKTVLTASLLSSAAQAAVYIH